MTASRALIIYSMAFLLYYTVHVWKYHENVTIQLYDRRNSIIHLVFDAFCMHHLMAFSCKTLTGFACPAHKFKLQYVFQLQSSLAVTITLFIFDEMTVDEHCWIWGQSFMLLHVAKRRKARLVFSLQLSDWREDINSHVLNLRVSGFKSAEQGSGAPIKKIDRRWTNHLAVRYDEKSKVSNDSLPKTFFFWISYSMCLCWLPISQIPFTSSNILLRSPIQLPLCPFTLPAATAETAPPFFQRHELRYWQGWKFHAYNLRVGYT